jgi:integrase
MTFLLTETGVPFSAAGFGNWFMDRCNEAGLPHCSAHGLRKACPARLANAGCMSEQIKAITNHKTVSEVAATPRPQIKNATPNKHWLISCGQKVKKPVQPLTQGWAKPEKNDCKTML